MPMPAAQTAQAAQAAQTWRTITDPKAAEVLTNPQSLRYLKPFLLRERSASEAAEVAKVNLDTMLYRVKVMLEMGLLTQTSLEARRGRSIKRYKTVADHFAIPFEATKAETIVALMLEHSQTDHQDLMRGMANAIAGGRGGWLVRVYVENRTLRQEITPDDDPDWVLEKLLEPRAPSAFHACLTLRLNPQEAKALQHELSDLRGRLAALLDRPASPSEKPYTVQLGLAGIVENFEP